MTAAASSTGRCYQYEYAATGNRTALTVTHQAAVTLTGYTYNAADRLLSLRTGSQVISPTYDQRGNLTYDGIFTYTYDALGRLTRATGVTVTAVYTYNGDGLRVAQAVNGAETRFTWDQAAARPQVVATSGGQTAQYLYGLELLGVQQGGQGYSPLADALGSLRQWTDAAGAVVGSASYDPFGGVLSQPGFTSPWGFAGEYHDPLTGLQYLRARWYQPGVGRFTQGDPFPGVLALPLTQNPYVYAVNNPINLTDPTGENPLLLPILAAAMGSALFGGILAATGEVIVQGLPAYLQGSCHLSWNMGAIAGAFVNGFLSTLIFELAVGTLLTLPASGPVAILGTMFIGFLAGSVGSVWGDAWGRTVEYLWNGYLPPEKDPLNPKTYVASFLLGGLFGMIGGTLKIANKNAEIMHEYYIKEIRFLETYEPSLLSERGFPGHFRTVRGWEHAWDRASMAATHYNGQVSAINYGSTFLLNANLAYSLHTTANQLYKYFNRANNYEIAR